MYKPNEIVENYIATAKAKTGTKWYKTLVLAVLAGVYIAFAAVLATTASAGFSGAPAALIKGAVFPVGLILVVVCGAELFTGNCLLVAPTVGKKIRVRDLFKNWGIVYGGNLIGGVLLAVLVVYSHVMNDTVVAAAVATAAAKSNMNFGDALLRGVLCNMLVCLAVWAAMASRSTVGKIVALYMPVFAFVVCGFEHSVANMYYLAAGLMTGAEYGIAASGLTFGNALAFCLIPSTIGNIIGGCLIALAYHFVYSKKKAEGEEKAE